MKNKFFHIILLVIVSLTLTECSNKNKASAQSEEGQSYTDGTYCAEVEYYNPNTGTRSTYTLEVEIENDELTVIHWPNGGWLDDSHFTPTDISSGEASFTSDRGIEYTVRIIGNEGDYTPDTYVTDEDTKTQKEDYKQQESEDNDDITKSEDIENNE